MRNGFSYLRLKMETVMNNKAQNEKQSISVDSKVSEFQIMIEKLYALADAATQGEWVAYFEDGDWDDSAIAVGGVEIGRMLSQDDTAFIAAANPAAIKSLIDEKDDWKLKYGQQQARCAVFMGAMATLARKGEQEFAQRIIAKADEAMLRVRLEDFVVARPASEPPQENDL